MAINITTFIGYAGDASYYINNDASGYEAYPNGEEDKQNADAVLDSLRSDYGADACIVSCSDDEGEFRTPDYGSPLKGLCIEYTVHY